MNRLKPWTEALKRGGYLTTSEKITSRGLLTVYELSLKRVLPVPVTPPVTGFPGGVTGFPGGVTGSGNGNNITDPNPTERKASKSW